MSIIHSFTWSCTVHRAKPSLALHHCLWSLGAKPLACPSPLHGPSQPSLAQPSPHFHIMLLYIQHHQYPHFLILTTNLIFSIHIMSWFLSSWNSHLEFINQNSIWIIHILQCWHHQLLIFNHLLVMYLDVSSVFKHEQWSRPSTYESIFSLELLLQEFKS